jgi:phage tail tube protein FII
VNSLEQAPRFEEVPDFGMDAFGMNEDFDINAAFQEAVQGVASDTELALEEKVRRMEVIVSEGASEIYRDFVDFRQMAAQMEMMCNHDHAFNQSIQGSEMLAGFMDSHKADDGHNQWDSLHDKHNHKDVELGDKKKKKKKKKKRGWFGISY